VRLYGERIQACATPGERKAVLRAIEDELEKSRRAVEARIRGWREIQSMIENKNDQLEFRRSGSILAVVAEAACAA
jgi:hypothetical protein